MPASPSTDNLQDLKDTRDLYVAELKAGPIKPSYSIDGQSVDWISYASHLVQMIGQLNNLILLFEPFENRTQAM